MIFYFFDADFIVVGYMSGACQRKKTNWSSEPGSKFFRYPENAAIGTSESRLKAEHRFGRLGCI
jgi:hypothetical protein